MTTIPASYSVESTPSVIAAAGNALALNGLMLTNSTRIPIGAVLSFPTGAAVTSYFGAVSNESVVANGGQTLGGNPAGTGYFGGYLGATAAPGALLAAQYNTSNVGAWLRGGNISGLSLTQLQAINGTLSVTIDGVTKNGTINLSAATSFSDAATIIADTLDIEGAQAASFNGAIAATTLTVSGVTGTIAIGQIVKGSGVAADTYITGGSGTTWTVNNSQSVGSEAMTTVQPGVTFDSISGGLLVSSSTTGSSSTITYATGTAAASLDLTQATGAVISQGAVAATPATFMAAIIAQTTNWASFFTAFNPDNSGNTNKLAFAAWANSVAPRYVYLAWDTDITPTESVPASTSLGYEVTTTLQYSGTVPIYEPTDFNHAAFIAGSIAAIDFTRKNGRVTFAYLTQPGLGAAVSDPTSAANLAGSPLVAGSFGNGYNFVGAFATANQSFINYQRGTISGPYKWLDSYVNQIAMTNAFQLAAYTYMTQVGSFPYNSDGYANFAIAMQGTIDQFKDFGAFSPGVTLSSTEIVAVNTRAGANIVPTLQTQGWYLQVLDPGPDARASRGSPLITFFYVDGGSVQALNIGSVAVQ